MTSVGLDFTDLTVAASAAGPYWGHAVSDLQTSVAVDDYAITGTLKYVSTGTLPTDWGPGNFMALAFSVPDQSATGHRVGLRPSEGSGMVPLDSDMDAVLKVTDKVKQKLVVESTDGTHKHRVVYDLSGLTCNGEA